MGLLEAVHEAEIDLFRSLNLAGTNDPLDFVMLAFTFLGGYIIVLVCVPLWLRGRKEAAFDLVVLVIVVTVATEALKLIIDRPRPFVELENVKTIVSSSGPSFPSAHASRAFAVACLIAIAERRRYGLAAFVVASFIAISRVYLGVHWPTDVLAGAIDGIAFAIALEQYAKKSAGYQALRNKTIKTISRREPDSQHQGHCCQGDRPRGWAYL